LWEEWVGQGLEEVKQEHAHNPCTAAVQTRCLALVVGLPEADYLWPRLAVLENALVEDVHLESLEISQAVFDGSRKFPEPFRAIPQRVERNAKDLRRSRIEGYI